MAGNMTSSLPLTNKEASIGTAPAARMAWMFFWFLLQLHNALQALQVSWKSSSSLGRGLPRLFRPMNMACANFKGVTKNPFTGPYEYFVLADDWKRKPGD